MIKSKLDFINILYILKFVQSVLHEKLQHCDPVS